VAGEVCGLGYGDVRLVELCSAMTFYLTPASSLLTRWLQFYRITKFEEKAHDFSRGGMSTRRVSRGLPPSEADT
jgi:hypothetical protein